MRLVYYGNAINYAINPRMVRSVVEKSSKKVRGGFVFTKILSQVRRIAGKALSHATLNYFEPLDLRHNATGSII